MSDMLADSPDTEKYIFLKCKVGSRVRAMVSVSGAEIKCTVALDMKKLAHRRRAGQTTLCTCIVIDVGE